MRTMKIGRNDAGQRLDKFLAKAVRGLPASLMYKFIRTKKIKVNRVRAEQSQLLREGDEIQLFIKDEFFGAPSEDKSALGAIRPKLDILYEDEHILLLNKRPGVLVHDDAAGGENTLILHVQAYLYGKGEYDPADEQSFAPALCNRIDRNTGGIVMAAKNAETLRVLNQKIRDREIAKYYLAVIHGRMSPPQGKLEGFLLKDEDKAQVKVYSRPVPGGKSAATLYKTLRTAGGLSLVECELLTGRTHQIRAQFAAAGHPLLGDGKYGRERDNKKYGRSFQALYSYKLAFTFPTDAGLLEYLRGRVFTVEQVDFVAEYFPGTPRKKPL